MFAVDEVQNCPSCCNCQSVYKSEIVEARKLQKPSALDFLLNELHKLNSRTEIAKNVPKNLVNSVFKNDAPIMFLSHIKSQKSNDGIN